MQSLYEKLASLSTEQQAPELADIDLLSISERCGVQNRMDGEVAQAVGREIEDITQVVSMIAASFRAGGRLIYVGAGTSGRLGVLDAAECPPTFGTDPALVQAIIAGGESALVRAVEGVEDDFAVGALAIDERQVGSKDCVVGITASGRTPFVLGAIRRAQERGAGTAGLTNNRPSELAELTQPTIAIVVGPEFIAGSTRLKAGTAQKLVLNMLTTQAMVEIGKTFGNMMVDVMATNEKLTSRALRMVRRLTGADEHDASAALSAAGGNVKLAVLTLLTDLNPDAGRQRLQQAEGKLREALALNSENQRDDSSPAG